MTGLFFVFLKDDKSLTEIIQPDKYTHSDKHGYVFLKILTLPLQNTNCQRLCYSICDQVTHSNIDDEFQNHFPVIPFVLESEIFIQEKTHDAANHIICGRGDPITAMKYIIKEKHDPGTNGSIHEANQDKLPEGSIK